MRISYDKVTVIFQLLVLLGILYLPHQYLMYSQTTDSTLTINGTDPTEPRNRFDASLSRIEPVAAGYILQTTFSGNLAVKDWGGIGLKVPLVYADFPSTQTFEMGDLQLNALWAFYRPRFEGSLHALALGVDAFLNTGDVETGTGYGQYIIAPFLAASFYPADEIMITPIIEQFFSLDEDEFGRDRKDLSIRLNMTATFDEFWVTLVPEILIDETGRRENLWTMRSSIGYMFDPRMGVSAEYVSQLAGDKRFNYLGRFAFRYLIP
jgi:hypothetical protein